MTKSKVFFYFCLSFMGGIFLSSQFSILGFSPTIIEILLLLVLIVGLILISTLWNYKKIVIFGFAILFLVLGIWRHYQVELGIMNNELEKYREKGENIILIGIVSKEPEIKEKSSKITVKVDQVLTEIGSLLAEGNVLVTVNRYPEYKYGDKLKIIGKLETPPVFEDFNYQNYLKKDGIFTVMSWPKIEVVGYGFGNPLMKTLFSFKNKFKEIARTFIPPPQESILEALVFGDEDNISQEWQDKLNFTGTRHIAAVSGMNITILAVLILSFALSFGLWRNQAFYLSIFLLILYILMIGAPASGVRAGIMAILFLTAQYFGRLSSATRTVFFAAAFMLVQNPLLLTLDVGFQLSFLAILGIIFLQPAFSNWFKILPNPKFFPLRTTLAATLAAQVFTLPILIYNFGYVPLLSPITNILIVPFLAPITILIFILGLTGIIFWPLGYLLSWPTWFSLTYIVRVIDCFSKLSFTSLVFKSLHWIWLVIFYLVLGFIVWQLQEQQKLKFLKY